ncbi:MAG: sigma 54-interacting transcriptional regulator [Deltaproteobacteria bacterium]|nr:sigma 54-interacting transcriptional regulator [Deltaproteobacteria bacterium]
MILFHRYELIRTVQEGVHFAKDLLDPDVVEVVLKEVRADGDRTRDELVREFRTVTGMRHPGIVRALDFGGDASGACYLTMVPVDGKPLDQVGASASPVQVTDLFVQAADALAWAHRHGVLHGDLKPQNLLARLGPPARLTVIDFGLARPLAGDVPAVGGSAGFLAPEILSGARPSVATDLWGLGAAFLAALTGEPPRPFALAPVVRHPAVPAALAPVLESLLAPDPAARPVDAHAVLRRLGASATAGSAELPFAGRRTDLDLLCRRRPGALLLRGPEGVGRTRLLREARRRLQLEGRLVAATDLGRGIDHGVRPALLPRLLRVVASLARDEAASGAVSFEPCTPQDAVELLHSAAPAGPTLLLDDLDPAPAAEQDRVRALCASCVAEPHASLLVACAPGAVADALLAEVPGLDVLDLAPLDRGAVGALVAAALGRPDDELARIVHDRSGGIPAHVVDLLQGLGERTERGEVDANALRLSPDAAVRVRRKMAELSPAERDGLAVLAALDRPAPLDELAACAPACGETELGRLEAAGLATRGPAGWRLLAPATASAVLGPDARVLHARLAERLERRGADAAELDRHRGAAGDLEAALRVASALASRGAFREAFEALAPFRPAVLGAAGERPEPVLAWAEAAARAGEHAAARAAFETLAEHAEPGVRARASLGLGETLERLGDLAGARTRLESALGTLAHPSQRAVARLRLARIAGLGGDFAAAADHARAGLEEHGGHSIPLRVQLGNALARLGSTDAALETLESALREAEASGDRRLIAATAGNLAILRSSRGELPAARDLFLRALSEAEAAGDTAALPAHLLNLAGIHQSLQEPAAAIELLRRAETLARRLGRAGPLGAALINLGNLYAEIGADDEALLVAREARELAERTGVRAVAAQAALVLAEIEARRDPERGRRSAAEARAAFEAMGESGRAAEASCVEGEIAAALADPATAREALARGRATAGPGLGPRLDLLEAAVLRAEGAAAAAMERLERSVTEADRAKQGDLAARAEAAAADLLDEIGSPLGGERRRRAAERWSAIALGLPPALREAFWRVPWRRRAGGAGSPDDGHDHAAVGGEGAALRLLALAPRIAAERDAQRVLELALDAGLDVLGGERGFLLLRAGDDWRVAAARNIDHESIRRAAFKFSRSVAEEVAQSGEPLLTANAVEDPRLAAARSVHQLALQSILCVPIRSPERVLGTIYVENRFTRGRFGERHLRLAQALADQVALALEAGRLERELRDRAEELDRARQELARRVESQEDELARLEREVRRSREEVVLRHEYAGIVGRGAAMRRLLETLDRAADTSLPVLIEGPTGTGKELVARALHANGPRRGRPFVSVNCGALPDLLLESELFGHARGAFTGADRARTGLMREASGGTLFLDEVGEMSAAMQVKLLRALQNGEVTPLGTDRAVPIDVRVVAATNRRLRELVQAGRFREDLFYRLDVIHLDVPPLSERREDVPELAAHFLRRAADEGGGAPKKLSRGALAALLRREFPGNVRELENLLRRAVVFAPGEEIQSEDLPPARAAEGEGSGLPAGRSRRDVLRAADRRLVEQVLRECGHNLSAAARRLGVSRPTLYRRMGEYGLGRPGGK